MKTECNVIRDLLPLYRNAQTSDESNRLVEAHFLECEHCKNAQDTLPLDAYTPKLPTMEQFTPHRSRFGIRLTLLLLVLGVLSVFSMQEFGTYNILESGTAVVQIVFTDKGAVQTGESSRMILTKKDNAVEQLCAVMAGRGYSFSGQEGSDCKFEKDGEVIWVISQGNGLYGKWLL